MKREWERVRTYFFVLNGGIHVMGFLEKMFLKIQLHVDAFNR